MWHQVLDADDVAALYASADPLYDSNNPAYVNSTKIVEYTYDAFDRRILKEIDSNGNGDMTDALDEAHQYVYDGQDIVLAFDKDAALTNRYLHGPAVDQILADEQYGAEDHDDPAADEGIVYWPLADNQGSVRQLVTSDGEEAKRIEYDSFGQMTVVSGAAVDRIFAYTGREHDAESHLQYNRARYYDAALGRWISEDPIGFAAGDANLSRYVGNGPTNATDPSGLDALDDAVHRERVRQVANSKGNCLKGCHDGAKHYGAPGAMGQGVADFGNALNRAAGQAIQGLVTGTIPDADEALDGTTIGVAGGKGAIDGAAGYADGLGDALVPDILTGGEGFQFGPQFNPEYYAQGKFIGEWVGVADNLILTFIGIRGAVAAGEALLARMAAWAGTGCGGFVSGSGGLVVSSSTSVAIQGALADLLAAAPGLIGQLGLAGLNGAALWEGLQNAFSKPGSAPVGSRSQQIPSIDGNPPTTINGRAYSGHAVDRMQGRGLTPSVVDNAIKPGNRVGPGNTPGTSVYTDSVNNVTAVVDDATGRVVTVF